MKRLWQYTGLTLLGLAIVAVVTAWLLIATEVGSRWLLSRLLMQSPVAVQVAGIEGRLSDRLVLRKVESNWQGGSMLIEELTLAWSPWSLPWRHVNIDRLTTKSLILSLDASEESPPGQPLRLAWPSMPQWLQEWRVNLATLSMEDTRLGKPGEQDLVAEQVGASIRLDKGRLFLDNVEMQSRGQHLSANMELNMMTPGVAAKLRLDSQDIVNEVAIKLDLDQGTTGDILAGPLTGRVKLQEQPEYRFDGTVQVGENRLSISGLMVSRVGLEGTIAGNLELNLAEDMSIASELAVSRWALPLEQDSLLVLDGRLAGTGSREVFQGQFDLTTTGPRWLSGHLAGDWAGNRESLQVLVQNGSWLGSSISGSLATTLNQAPVVKASMAIKGLDPAQFSADWNGYLNLNTDLEISGIGKDLRVQFATAFLDSQLRNVPLQGTASGRWFNDNLELNGLNLDGDGFKVDAAGSLTDRLDLSFDITDLGGIIPQSTGKLRGSGWVGLREQDWIASLSATIDSLNYDKASLKTANLTLDRLAAGTPARLRIKAVEAGYDTSQLDSVELLLDGDIARHTATLSARFEGGNVHLEITGRHENGLWQGDIIALSINHDQFGLWQLSAPLIAQYNESYFELGPMQLHSSNGGLSLSGRFRHNGLPEQMHMTVSRLPLSLFNDLVSPRQLSGTLDMDMSCSEKSCHLLASGLESIGEADSKLIFKDMQFDGLWDDTGLQAEIKFELAEGHIIGRLSSASPRDALSVFPLGWSLSCERIPLEQMFIIPRKYTLSGTWGGQAQGILNQNLTFSGQGQFETVRALFSWQDEDSEKIDFTVNEAATTLNWHEDALQGTLALVMEEHGQLSAAWQLPIPARWPITPTEQGQVNGHFGGWLTENGLAGILWPEFIQETQGDIEVDTLVEGTWDKPLINGLVHLQNGGGYLPGTGVKLDVIELVARFDGQQILLDKLTASSAPAGTLTGDGVLRMQGWKPDHLELSIRGEDFALMHLPELQVKISPDLKLSGTHDNLLLTGNVHIPALLVTGREQRSPVQVSPDVIVVDRETDEVREMPFRLATRVNLTLGDKILVRMFGLDARLGGQVELTGIDPQHFFGNGQITIEEGSFATYGVKLDIDKGRASYGGGPLDNPALDILALKKAADAKVGVQIRGTAKQPEVTLYSEPTMADTDILSFIVLGRPLNQAGGETDPLMLAAGALLSAGDSAVLRNRLQSQLGIDTLEAESETGETTDTILRLGKYLTPDLYLSYGYALFGQRSEVGLRYHIYKGWEAESKFGVESGADIYYRFEFD